LIESYAASMNFEDFKKDRKTIDAVVRNFEIIGEAARNIPDEIKIKYQNVDWEGMIGLSNRVVDGYFGINLTIIWEILKRELPPFFKGKDKADIRKRKKLICQDH
jgi:uncharacterized protein with HEPN domain